MVFDQSEPSYISILKELDKKLSAGTIILVLSKNDTHLEALKKGNWSKRIKVVEKTNSGLSKWVRDPFLVFNKKENQIFVNEFFKDRKKPNLNLASHLNEVDQLIDFEYVKWFDAAGGNVLTDNKYVFIGWNHFSKTMNKLHGEDCEDLDDCYRHTQEQILKLLNRENSTFKELIVIGRPAVEKTTIERSITAKAFKELTLFDSSLWKTSVKSMDTNSDEFTVHIDAFISLTGQNYNQKPIIFLAFAVPTKPELAEKANNINKELDSVVEYLSDRFCIMRNPVPVVENNDHYTCFYNNCLVEVTTTTKTVWIPSFATGKEKWKKALKPYDEANQGLWKSIGFKAVLIYADFHNLCEHGNGALHCITNELIRY